MPPDRIPAFREMLTGERLARRREEYRDYIEIIHYFVNKYLSTVSGDPILIAVSDARGYLLELEGDPSILETIQGLGIREGVRFSEELGTNAIDLSLRLGRPFKMTGSQHYHDELQEIACYTAPFRSSDGTRMLGTLSLMTRLSFAHPHLLALLGTMAESVERELKLRRQNEQLQVLNQVLLETPYYGVIVTDPSGAIIEMNEQGAAMLGLRKSDRTSRLGTSVFRLALIGEAFRQVIARQEECLGREVAAEQDEAVCHYLLDVLPVYDLHGDLIRIVGTLRDITERKATEEVLRNTEKLVFAGQLAVSIAHEVRNPLTTVKGMLQLAEKEQRLRYYELIMSELERMNLIVGEFLILCRPQAAQLKEESSLTILNEVLGLFAIQASLNQIEIRCDCRQEVTVPCDRNQIKQVFLNILRNAMEALPFGGRITIALDEENGGQTIRFTDNGVGMPADILQRIGEPFHTTKPEGNGLGMMIVKRIIESHGGRLRVDSEVDNGTTVEVFLPGCVGRAEEYADE